MRNHVTRLKGLGTRTVPQKDGGIFTVTENASAKTITAENNAVKIVWHYQVSATNSAPYYNRGGGNIYYLYHKWTDPTMQKNIVGLGNEGTGGSGLQTRGIGGLGATSYYYKSGETIGIVSACDCNLTHEVFVSKSSSVNANGEAVVSTTHKVKTNPTYGSLDTYQITKNWLIKKDGTIEYEPTTILLRDFSASEPSYVFNFSQDYGWKRGRVLRHTMLGGQGNDKCYGIGSNGFRNVDNDIFEHYFSNEQDTNFPGLHAQVWMLDGADTGLQIKLTNNKKDGGYERSGFFRFGYDSDSNQHNEISSEFSNGITLASEGGLGRAIGFLYYAWWGGGNPPIGRYKSVTNSYTYTDHFTIELIDTNISLSNRLVRQRREVSL